MKHLLKRFLTVLISLFEHLVTVRTTFTTPHPFNASNTNTVPNLNMAKIKFTAIMADARGKLNGTVFSKNRGGSYMRTKVSPINPQTASQVAARASLTARSQTWRTLASIDRLAWNAAVENFKKTDIFGDIKTPSGINLYNRLNMNIVKGGGTVIAVPPSPTTSPVITSLSVAASDTANTMTATFAVATVPANQALIIEATPQVSPGKYFVKSEFRVIQTVAAAGTSPANIYAAYTAKFGALVAGQKVFIRAYFVDITTGLQSQALQANTIVV